jgi:ABC-type transport system involved in cytochrome c biogenesis permease subunit
MAAYLLGGLLTALGLGRAARSGRPSWWTRIGVALTVIGILLTAGGIAVRSVIAGFGPVTNLYGTFTWVALVSSALGLVLARLTGKGVYAVVAGIAAGLCVLVGHVIPPDYRQIEQLQPVLRSQYWLVVHVMTEVASYAAFLVAWLLGNIVLWDAWRRRAKVAAGDAQAIYRALQVGVVLVAAGTLLGAVWADKAWGRFWGWDPKEVWALVTFLTYLVPLHLRYAGAVGPTGLAAWSVLGFLSVVMSWWGVNFFIGAGLHAYATGHGFGTFTTDQLWVFVLSGAQAALTAVQVLAIRRATSAPVKAVPADDLASAHG